MSPNAGRNNNYIEKVNIMNIIKYAVVKLIDDIKEEMPREKKDIDIIDINMGINYQGIYWHYVPEDGWPEKNAYVFLYFNDSDDGEWFIEITKDGDTAYLENIGNMTTDQIIGRFVATVKMVIDLIA